MNTELEQLQHLGFLGIFKESYKIIISWWKQIFSQIFLALILPFCLIILADMLISDHLLGQIIDHHITLDDTWSDDPKYNQLKHKLAVEWSLFGVFNFLYFIIGLMVFFLFSISAIAYTVARIYASKDNTFKQVMRVVPKVWKKLVITFLWNFFIQFVYNAVFVGLLAVCLVLARANQIVLGIVICAIVVILFIVGLVYINVIWVLASVVSVLEDCYGLRAFKRSRALLKGKMKLNIGIFVTFQVMLVVIQGGYFVIAAIFAGAIPIVVYVIAAIVFLLGLLVFFQLALVVQTIMYFVCKSHHHESIDKSSLANHLESYLGQYGRLGGGKDVQSGQLGV